MKNQRVYSITLVKKIMQVLLEKGEIGRTELSQTANIHYSRLLEQLSSLEQKQQVVLVVKGRKIVVRLTEKGREFGTKLMELEV